jgi:hypothetical protein
MKTQLIGSNEYAENGDIINAELEKARFIGEWIEFETRPILISCKWFKELPK